jgi:cytochrome c oxidase assembly protein subunit 11
MRRVNNRTIGVTLAAVIVAMVGVSFAAIPLYRVFCSVTGYDGTPQIGPESAPGAQHRMITVRFNANTNPNLPWEFAPVQREVTLPLGEEQLAFYTARNLASTPVTGIALYNVTPDTVGKYFHKTACFCFNQQTLAAGQQMQFPLSFWVDPAIAKDPNTADIHTITLSYTFFRTLEDAEKSGALAQAGPHVGPLTRQTP